MTTPEDLSSNLIELLASRELGLPLTALVADVLAADARFNDWIAFEGKRTLSSEAILQTIDTYEDTTARCHAEIQKFRSTRESKPLEAVLNEALQALRQIRE